MTDSKFKFGDTDFADESVLSVKDDVKRQLAGAGLDDGQAERERLEQARMESKKGVGR
jgi:DUF1365 family protein